MLNYGDVQAVDVIRSYLDELSYHHVGNRLLRVSGSSIYFDFKRIQDLLRGLSYLYRLVFSVLYQGHSADEHILKRVLPSEFMQALIDTGLLTQNNRAEWKTPGLCMLPVQGLYVVAALPLHYPVAAVDLTAGSLGAGSISLVHTLPARLSGKRVLDICTGPGLLGLVCSSRGAANVVGLDDSEQAVAIARFNAQLNGLADVMEIRHSDELFAVHPDERFDLVVAVPPSFPDIMNPGCPFASVQSDPTTAVDTIFENLADCLTTTAEGRVFCYALGGQYEIEYNRARFPQISQTHGLYIRAYVTNKMPLSSYVHFVTGFPHTEKIAVWLDWVSQTQPSSQHIYEQVIRFWKARNTGFANLPVYDRILTDPLYHRASMSGD